MQDDVPPPISITGSSDQFVDELNRSHRNLTHFARQMALLLSISGTAPAVRVPRGRDNSDYQPCTACKNPTRGTQAVGGLCFKCSKITRG